MANTKKTEQVKTPKKKVEAIKVEQPQMDMNQMFAMFQQFMTMQQAQQPTEVKKEVSTTKTKLTKTNLRKLRGNDDVIVTNITSGSVSFKSPKTGIMYHWTSEGDEEIMPVDEIIQMESTSRRFLHDPWLSVEDEEIVQVLGLEKVAKVVDKLKNTDEVLEEYNIEYIEELLGKSTPEYKDKFASTVLEKIKNDELRDTVLIRELGRILNINFELYK